MFFIDHAYFFAGCYVMLWCILFFLIIKDTSIKKMMLLLGIYAMIGAAIIEQIYLIDWWHPRFLYDFPVHIEDILFGFGLTGTVVAVWSIVKNKKERSLKLFPKNYKWFVAAGMFGLLYIPFYFFGLNSFWGSLLSLSFVVAAVLLYRKEVLGRMLYSGIFLTALILPGYYIELFFRPNWIKEEWLLTGLPGITFYGMPIGEPIWYLFAGMAIAGFCELMLPTTSFSKN